MPVSSRTIQRFEMETRAEVEGNTIVGLASVFGQAADLGPHYEMIHRSAFDRVLGDDATDVRAFVNHDHSKLLGRQSAGTLDLRAEEGGLWFRIHLPDTSYANDVRELVRRGDMTGASFGFVPGDDEWSRASDGKRVRTHTSIRGLPDVSVVTFPAYKGAGVALRSIEFGAETRAAEFRRKLILAKAARNLQIGAKQ